jgi:hypothetical protein
MPTDWWNIGAGLGGAAVGAAATYVAMLVPLNRVRKDAVASYLDTMSEAATGMADEFESGRVPYSDGHAFASAIEPYERHLHRYLGAQVYFDLAKWKTLAQKAESMDGRLARDLVPDPEDLKRLTADLRRTAGELRFRAAELRARR